MHEDLTEGIIVCHDCGVCETMLISDELDYRDVDWNQSSMITKSQHKPIQYIKNIIRKFDIDYTLENTLLQRYQAVIYWSERLKPDDRKSLPSYRKCLKSNVV